MKLSVGRCCIISVVVLLIAELANANETIVELPLQRVTAIRGFVVFPDGTPAVAAQVVELSSDWKTEIRRTETDSTGHFSLRPVKGRKTYFLQVTAKATGINPLRVPVQISRWHGKNSLRLQVQLA